MSNEIFTKKKFSVGEIVKFIWPPNVMIKIYGFRAYEVANEPEGFFGNRVKSPKELAENNSTCLILDYFFKEKHGFGTHYYKVLLNEKLFWIDELNLDFANA